MNKILLTGGSGKLGTLLQKYLDSFDAPSHEELDVIKPIVPNDIYTMVVHCAAYTNVREAEKEHVKCIEINYKGTRNLRNAYKFIPFVYISSEYASVDNDTWYGLSKAMGEFATKEYEPYLILRTYFKPKPFPYDKAFIDQYTQGDYVDVIAELIAKEINKWDRKTSQTIYVGTGRKTVYQLAIKTRPDVKPCSIHDIEGLALPSDYL